uniref:Solute carrier family 13 member 2 n=1 Tax=Panagrolaimus sp. JU765 TaxID=591449 RepID=A0AC34QZU6_9BILA
MAFLWITETIPMAVTALIPVVLYPVFSVMKSEEICKEYLSDTNFVFFGSMLMAIGVETTKLHERVALRILMTTGSNSRWLLLGFQIATAFISMWISNTATTALVLPMALSVICELDYCRRRQENPSEIIIKRPIGDINFEKIPSHDRNLYKALLLSICFGSSIGGTGTIVGTGPNLIMKNFVDKNNYGKVTFANWMIFAVPSMIFMLIFLWCWLQVLLIGFRRKTGEEQFDQMVSKVIKEKYDLLGPVKFSEKLIGVLFSIQVFLWFFRKPQIFPGWGDFFPDKYVTDATVAMSVSILLFVLPSKNPFDDKSGGKDFEPIVTWRDMHERFSWGTILLLGGGIAMAKGVEKSGLSDIMGEYLSSFSAMPEWAFILVACFLVTALTEFSSNIATASIFIPLVASVAKEHGTNALLYILPTTLSCSYAFALPAGTPPNAIVFSAGILKITDLLKAGLVLNVFGYMMVFLITHSYAPLIFNFQSLSLSDVYHENITVI